MSQNWNNLLDLIPDWICSVDADTFQIGLFNQSMARDLEAIYQVQIQAGMQPDKIFNYTDCVHILKLYHETLQKGTACCYLQSFQGIRQLQANLVIDGQQKMIALRARLLTEQECLSVAEANQIQIFNVLHQHALTGFYMFENGKIVYVNEAFANIFGYPASELIGAEPALIIYPEDLERVHESIRLRLNNELPYQHYEFRGLRKDGKILWIEVLGVRSTIDERVVVIGSLIDITARKEFEASLQHETKFLEGLIHTIPDLVWLKDPDGVYLRCNRRFEALFGASESDIIGKRDVDFVGAELAAFFLKNDQAAIQAKTSKVNEEWLSFATDGYTGLFETIKTPMFAENGDLLGVLGIAREITTQKKTEENLKSLIQIHAVLSAINEAIIRIREPQKLFEEICQIAVQIGGFRMAWVGQRDSESEHVVPICHAGHSDGYVEKLHLKLKQQGGPTSRAMLSGHPFICQDIATDPVMATWREAALERNYRSSASFPIMVNDALLASVNLYADRPGFFDQQQVELLLQLSADLSFALEFAASEDNALENLERMVQKRTRELESSERRFRYLIEGIKQDYIFYIVQAEGYFHYLSPSAESMIGLSMDQMIGKPWYEVLQVDAPDWQAVRQRTQSATSQEPFLSFEIQACLKGEKQILEVSQRLVFDDQGKALSAEGVIKNVSRQKQIEAELREAKEKAEKSSQAKSQFLSHMSHELRTPLNVILGYSELLQEQLHEERWQKFIRAINSSGHTLLNIINDILDLNKIEAGKIELQSQKVKLDEMIKDLELMMNHGFEQKNLHFTIELESGLPEYVLCDALRLRQILLNLLNNALKYTHAGSVTLRVSMSRNNGEGDSLVFEVMDTGPGISAEFLRRIYEPFAQDPASGKINTGTGLGLPITRRLVELMQGQIEIESTPGEGSLFKVSLPYTPVDRLDLPDKSEPCTEIRQTIVFEAATVLLADDLPVNLALLQDFLSDQNLRLILANNGQVACDLALKEQPNLIVMDIKMPIMNGVEAMKQLRQNPATQAIPMIALTAYSLEQEAHDFLKQGFDAYLRKPVKKVELINCLARFLKHKTTGEMPSSSTAPESRVQQSLPVFEDPSQWLLRWQSIKDSLIQDDLERFSADLFDLAQKSNWAAGQQYAQELLICIHEFRLEEAIEHLQVFPKLIEA